MEALTALGQQGSQIPGSRGKRYPRPGVPTTIYQVAEHAGVSIATVSRVFRADAPVAADTRARVLSSAKALRYTPSHPARSLAQGKQAASGIILPGLSGPYFAEVVLGYEEMAAEFDRSVLILSTHGRQATDKKVMDLAARVDGLVVIGRTVDDAVLAELVSRGKPLILVARDCIVGADAVNAENEESARALTTHLVRAHGYTSLSFLGDVDNSPDTAQRWRGFARALAEADIAVPDRPIPCAPNELSGRQNADRVLSRRPPRALVCANDEIALGAIEAAEGLGLRVPGDVAVTGWDDVMAARHSRPGLTTVRQPMRELGAVTARRLHERLAGGTGPPHNEVLATHLVLRASCGDHTKEDRINE